MKKAIVIAALMVCLLAGVAHARNDILGDSIATRAVTFANLTVACTPGAAAGACAPQAAGTVVQCSDCQQTSPCAGGGSGALALHVNSAWQCTTGAATTPTLAGDVNGAPGANVAGHFTLGSNASANSHKITSVAADTTTGDALSRGQSTMNSLAVPTGSVPMNSQKFTGLAAGTTSGDSLAFGQSGAQFNSLSGSGTTPTISGFHGSLSGAIDPTSNLNLACTAASTPYSFCTGAGAGTFTAAKGDARLADLAGDCTISAGSATLSCPGASFTSADGGKIVIAYGAGADNRLIGFDVSSGSINLTTGAMTVTFSSPVANGVAVAMTYASGGTTYTAESVGTGNGTAVTFTHTAAHTPVTTHTTVVTAGGAIDAVDARATDLVTTVSAVPSGTSLTLAATAVSEVAGQTGLGDPIGYAVLGTDDSAAAQAAINAAKAAQKQCRPEEVGTSPCAAHVVFPSASYMLASGLTTGQVSNFVFDASHAQLYCAGTGVCLSLNGSAGAVAVGDTINAYLMGTLGAATEGIKTTFTQGVQISGSADDFAVGYEVGTNPPSGSTSPNSYLSKATANYDVVGYLFHACDSCTLTKGLAFDYFDRAVVLSDPAYQVLTSPASAAGLSSPLISVFQDNANYATSQTGIDVGRVTGATIQDFYHEDISPGVGNAIRAGQIGGNVDGLTIVGGEWTTNSASQTALALGGNGAFTVKNVTVSGPDLASWATGVACGGVTSNTAFSYLSMRSVTTRFSGCGGFALDNGTPVELSGKGNNTTFNLMPIFVGTGATPLEIEKSGDANPRYQFMPGTGLQIGNSSVAPTTTIDESRNGTFVGLSGIAPGSPIVTMTHTSGGTDTPNLSTGAIQVDSVSDGNAFTIANPTSPTNPQYWQLRIANTSAGVLGAVTWGAAYKVGTFTAPGTGKSRILNFYYDGTNHWLIDETGSDL